MQPITKKAEVAFRGPTSSEEMNDYINDSHYDLTQLFNLASEHGIKIPANLDLLMRENHFLVQKINDLAIQLQNLEDQVANNNTMLRTFHSTVNTVAGNPSTVVNTNYRALLQPIVQEVSKLYLLSDGKSVMPQELQVTLYESDTAFADITNIDPMYEVEDQNIYNAFDVDDTKYWQRKVAKDASVNELYAAIHIKLPQNIINTLKANTIYLIPSPQFSQSILDIQYKQVNTWHRIETYPVTIAGQTTPNEIPESSNEIFVFPQVDMTELVIYIKQPNWFDEDSQHVFVYGFNNIGVFFSRFDESDTTIQVKFELPNPGLNFNTIDAVIINSAKGGVDLSDENYSGLVSYVVLPEGSSTPIELGATLQAGITTVYVELTVKTNKSVNVSPVIGGIELEYTTV